MANRAAAEAMAGYSASDGAKSMAVMATAAGTQRQVAAIRGGPLGGVVHDQGLQAGVEIDGLGVGEEGGDFIGDFAISMWTHMPGAGFRAAHQHA